MKKTILKALIFLIILTNSPHTCFAETLSKPPKESIEELYHDMFLTLLMPYIETPITQHYSTYISLPPTVYGYMINITHAERVYGYRSFRFEVTLEVTPVVGPHISVGKDRLVFEITTSGPKLVDFRHIETHTLPEHWQHILKGSTY